MTTSSEAYTDTLHCGGEPTVVGEASGNPYMYTGREYDPETGLYFFRNRYQSPILGRFISEDPLGVQAGLNFYAYVNGNPVNYIDPWGLTPGQPPIGPSIDPGQQSGNSDFIPIDYRNNPFYGSYSMSKRSKCIWLLRMPSSIVCGALGYGANYGMPGSMVPVSASCRIFFESLSSQLCPDDNKQQSECSK